MMKNILVGFDFHKNMEVLVQQSTELAGKFDSKIWLVHVAAPDPDFVGYEPGPQYIRDDRATELKEEHKKLLEYADRISEKGIESEALLIQGATVRMLLKETEKLQIDLIILGRHEHGFLYNLFFENVSQKVSQKSDVPILVIPLE